MILQIFAWLGALSANFLACWAFYEVLVIKADKSALTLIIAAFAAILPTFIAMVFFAISGWYNVYWIAFVLPVILFISALMYR